MTTASSPSRLPSASLASMTEPTGVQATRRPGRSKACRIHHMETIHILVGIDGVQDLGRYHLLGQRQLHQYAMHGRILVQLVDQSQKLCFRGRAGSRCSQEFIPTSTVCFALLAT